MRCRIGNTICPKLQLFLKFPAREKIELDDSKHRDPRHCTMSSFFTFPSNSRKRKRTDEPGASARQGRFNNAKKTPKTDLARSAPPRMSKRDDSISGSDDDSESAFLSASETADGPEAAASSDDDDEASGDDDTAATRRLRLAERYLSNLREEVAEEQAVGFDAADLDRDLIAERLREDVAETKGRLYRRMAADLDLTQSTHSHFGWDGLAFTSLAICEPWVYTASKDLGLGKWKIQDLPKDQMVPREEAKKKRRRRKALQKVLPPPRRKPERVAFVQGNKHRAKDPLYQGHTDIILAIAASQDGNFVVTGGRDRKIIVWDTHTLKVLKIFSQHRDAVTGLVFRRGTNQLYSSSKDRTLKVWSLDELAYVETLFGHQDEVVDVAALAQERCISVGARDRTARLWKVAEETQLVFRGGGGRTDKTRKQDKSRVPSIVEGSLDRVAMIDEEMFVTGGDSGSLSLWLIHKKKPVYTIPLCHGMEPALTAAEASAEKCPTEDIVPARQPRGITALVTVPYSDVILTGSWDGHIRMWRISPDKKKIEAIGVLGHEISQAMPATSSSPPDAISTIKPVARGIVNDLVVFERGDRGKDGLCVVAALGKEHRLGSWKRLQGKNGALVFEVPRLSKSDVVEGNAMLAVDGQDI